MNDCIDLTRSSLRRSMGDRIVWDGTDEVPLEQWISEIRPSHFSNDEGVVDYSLYCSWIQIHSMAKDTKRANDKNIGTLHISKYHNLLDDLERTIQSTNGDLSLARKECTNAIMRLAKQDGCVVGKWLVFSSSNETDALWERIAVATASGRLGFSSKVSPCGNNNQAVICVYVYDSTDQQEVQRIGKVLTHEMGIKGVLRFKPDIYTYIGIYGGNAWGLSPTLYTTKKASVWKT